MGYSPLSWAEILAVPLEKIIVFPKNSCSLIGLYNSPFEKISVYSGRQLAVPLIKSLPTPIAMGVLRGRAISRITDHS